MVHRQFYFQSNYDSLFQNWCHFNATVCFHNTFNNFINCYEKPPVSKQVINTGEDWGYLDKLSTQGRVGGYLDKLSIQGRVVCI